MIAENIPSIFAVGQIWHWNDPEYLCKSQRTPIPHHIAEVRYSRYVLIIQAPDTAEPDAILVVPLSSSNNSMHDVELTMRHLHRSQRTFAKCQRVFPVDPRCLGNYVTTADSHTVEVIRGELIRMMMTSVSELMGNDDLKVCGIDLTNDTVTHEAIQNQLSSMIEMFVQEKVRFSIDKRKTISSVCIREAFDSWCLANGLQDNSTMAEFVDELTYIVNRSLAEKQQSCRWMTDTQVSSIIFRGMSLVDQSEVPVVDVFKPKLTTQKSAKSSITAKDTELDAKEPKSVPKSPKKAPTSKSDPKNVWTDDMVKTYMNDYACKGPKFCSDKYGIAVKTTMQYAYTFRKKMKAKNQKIELTIPSSSLSLSE